MPPAARPNRAQACSLKARLRDARGAAAVEFALLAPVLLMMIAGVVAYGLYFGLANSVQQLAADAARASVAGLSDAERAQLASDRVAASAGSYVLLDPARATVTARPSPANADLFEVQVAYDASALAIWSFGGLVPLPTKTIVRSASIQRGGY
ncbi:TadE/TadG family type IV pilus assembly protein [Methylopila turkensis]|uniref:TadE/TadG family type IV pilus assembly protein n=1 Tax=Methylopila turkensis TaxID=1437816 RepID=UPI0022F2F881|nr:TadE/TadG family type IV pilus assembly protein [Methylopila turkensis]